MLTKILNTINQSKTFPLYFLTPLIYAVGNASESILLTTFKLDTQKKKIIILYPRFFQKILKYNICNKSLFDDIIINKSNLNQNLILKFFFNFFLEIEFFITRLFILTMDKFKIIISEKYRFPHIGLDNLADYGNVNNHNFYKFPFKKIKPFTQSSSMIIDLDYEKSHKCEKILKHITDKRRFICIHVRDSLYKKNNKISS